MKEGRKKGRKEGLKEGMKYGRKGGRKEGRKEERKKGRKEGRQKYVQYNGSNDDLDWRIDFKYLNFISITKFLRSKF